MEGIDETENLARMHRGEMYYAFTPGLIKQREGCKIALARYNSEPSYSRRVLIQLWRAVNGDKTPLPPKAESEDEDNALLLEEPYIDRPVLADFGTNIKLGKGVYLNSYSTFIDTSLITIGARTIVGPHCSFYSGGHPTDPFLRNGLKGPEFGKPIIIGEDCWLGGNVVVVPGVTIGRGVTVGAGSVVTRDIPEFSVAVGSPARVIKKITPEAPDPKTTL